MVTPPEIIAVLNEALIKHYSEQNIQNIQVNNEHVIIYVTGARMLLLI